MDNIEYPIIKELAGSVMLLLDADDYTANKWAAIETKVQAIIKEAYNAGADSQLA